MRITRNLAFTFGKTGLGEGSPDERFRQKEKKEKEEKKEEEKEGEKRGKKKGRIKAQRENTRLGSPVHALPQTVSLGPSGGICGRRACVRWECVSSARNNDVFPGDHLEASAAAEPVSVGKA